MFRALGSGRAQLQRNQVIDLRTYRGDQDDAQAGGDAMLDELPAGTVLMRGQYTITEYLNSGGFGITYRAKDSLGRPVVIKECYPSIMCLRKGRDVLPRNNESADELRKMIGHFVTEAHSLAALQHKNIVHVHQVFEENETAYMAIDFIDGLDLLDMIEQKPEEMTPDEIVRITKRMLPAISYVHSKDLLHRDIAPDNILIDATGEPILIDFGAARKKAKTSSRAFSKMKFVKDGYSPQEFYIEGAEQGPWSDLYSFAATLYHAISGVAPEDGQKRLSALAQKEEDPYQPLAGRFAGYPRGFLPAIDEALIIIPHKRIQTAEEWMSRLVSQPRRRSKPRTMIDVPKRTHQLSTTAVAQPKINEAEAEVRNSLKAAAAPTRITRTMLAVGGVSLAVLVGAGVVGMQFFAGGESDAIGSETAEPQTAFAAPPANIQAEAPIIVANPEVPFEAEVAAELPLLPRVTPIASDTIRDGFLALKTPVQRAEPELTIAASLPGRAAMPPLPRPAFLRPEAKTLDAVHADITASRTLPPPRWQDVLSDVPPAIAFPVVAETSFSFLSAGGVSDAISVAEIDGINLKANATTLGAIKPDSLAVYDATPPAAIVTEPVAEPTPPIAATPVTEPSVTAHWDIEMPFASTLVRSRNAHTIEIGEVLNRDVVAKSGEWVAKGVIIYTFNGEKLEADLPLSGHVLSHLNVDPDGFVRATVRYRAADTGRIDRGLLAVPVTREITLSDGARLQARVENMAWVTRVVEAGSSAFLIGDRLLSEVQTGVEISTEVGVETVIEGLAASGENFAEFRIDRNGEELTVSVSVLTPNNGDAQ